MAGTLLNWLTEQTSQAGGAAPSFDGTSLNNALAQVDSADNIVKQGDGTIHPVIAQATAEAGTDTNPFLWSSQRVKQAADAAIAASAATTLPTGYITGLLWSFASVSSFTISAGQCRDTADSYNYALASAMTKTTGSWVAGSGNGGLSSSLTFTASTTYHVFAITVGGSDDVGFDTSVTGATLVSDHSATIRRHLFSFDSDSTPNIPAHTTTLDGVNIYCEMAVIATDISDSTSSTRQVAAVSVPTGIPILANLRLFTTYGTTMNAWVTSTGFTDVAPAATNEDISTATGATSMHVNKTVLTDTSAQIAYRKNVAGGTITIGARAYTFLRGL